MSVHPHDGGEEKPPLRLDFLASLSAILESLSKSLPYCMKNRGALYLWKDVSFSLTLGGSDMKGLHLASCRYVRMSLMDRHWPGLVNAFNAKGQEKLELAAQKEKKR